ncbi:MAG: 5-(carboxyamino)imidazole ribonucleotide synthase [Rhodospirillaceae bacterium]|nr:MAG: 5-(carboxyamino)imidazole ribonucleotide synthase [Rhodospirillaceae bacterium]
MSMAASTPLSPGATIGILGNGQLGRMLCLAAARLGYRTHVYGPDRDSPAEQVATVATVAAYDDEAALAAFADAVDVITFEFENVPAQAAAFLAAHTDVRPSWRALEVAQDRTKEKTFFAEIGAATPPWRPIDSLDDLKTALNTIKPPAILKTARLGYDGKGQAKITNASDADSAWKTIGGEAVSSTRPYAILEGFVDFTREISVIAARSRDGATVCFEPTENVHTNHMLATSTVPAAISSAIAATACDIAVRAAVALDLVGLLAVEMFVAPDGTLLCNEMAPRPHNSGHWTMDGGGCDQFEMLVRAAAGLPLVTPMRTVDVTMINLVGDGIEDLERYYTDPTARVHLYGKAHARAGRKMGHVNIVRLKKS